MSDALNLHHTSRMLVVLVRLIFQACFCVASALIFLGLGVSACIRRRQSPLWYESNFVTCKQNTQDSMYPHSYMTCDILAPPPVSSASVYFRHVAVDLQGRCRCKQEMWQTGRLALQGGLLAYFAVHEIALPLLQLHSPYLSAAHGAAAAGGHGRRHEDQRASPAARKQHMRSSDCAMHCAHSLHPQPDFLQGSGSAYSVYRLTTSCFLQRLHSLGSTYALACRGTGGRRAPG